MRVALGRLADIQIGYQVKGKVLPKPGDTHRLVQTGDVGEDGQIAWDRLATYTPERKGAERYVLVDGDVLFLARGVRRVAAAVRNPRPGAIVVSTFEILRVRDDAVVLPEFLAWYLNVAAREEIAGLELRGVSMPFVPKDALAGLEVALPTTAVQQQVVALDALVRREARLAQELSEKRARLVGALTRRLVAGDGGTR